MFKSKSGSFSEFHEEVSFDVNLCIIGSGPDALTVFPDFRNYNIFKCNCKLT